MQFIIDNWNLFTAGFLVVFTIALLLKTMLDAQEFDVIEEIKKGKP